MKEVSFMDSVNGLNMRTEEVQKILEQIKKGDWKTQIEEIQYHISNGDVDKANSLKRKLPAFTISATFKERRKKDDIDSYTGLLHLDYDKLVNAQEVKDQVMEMPFTYAAFISPSGNGVKVIVKSDNDLSTHTEAFNALKDYYDGELGIESDKAVKDVTRLCFVSYDYTLYLNDESETYKHITLNNDLDKVWSYTSNKKEFTEGNRNNFIHSFACNANRQGYDMTEASNHAYSYSDSSLSKEEIDSAVKSAYENNVSEKGSVAKVAKVAISAISDEDSNPYIPDHIYDALPGTLKEACFVFKGRERDVFFTSALSVISGGLHNVYGLYANEKRYPNLFSFIIAPPASGKGSMKYAKQLGDCCHDFLVTKSSEEMKVYKNDKRLFDLKLKKAKTDQAIEALIEPEQPKSKMFFIPADTSSAMLVKHLKDNNGMGCICETEADTLTNTLKQDWGGYSDVLRKGFQGEVIARTRMTNLEYSEIKEPKFSVAITGTPNQLDSLITSIQDGLFSRFLFYSFVAKPVWKNTYTEGISRSNKEIFEDYSSALCDKFKSNAIQKFIMTREQGGKLDNVFREALGHNAALYNEEVSGVIYRLGLMSFKIAMVLSALRSNDTEITCSDEDFNTAMVLVLEVYMTHSINMLNRLNKSLNSLNLTQTSMLNWMQPKVTYKRSEISEKAEELGVKDRTLSDILNRLVKLNLVKKISHGLYSKT